VRQLLIPEWGSRLIMATDGVWDCISKNVVVATCKVRGESLQSPHDRHSRRILPLLSAARHASLRRGAPA
jgi:serine/threonine protein phosphatase PrpC